MQNEEFTVAGAVGQRDGWTEAGAQGPEVPTGSSSSMWDIKACHIEGGEVGVITSVGLKVRPTWIPVSALLLTSSGILGQVI